MLSTGDIKKEKSTGEGFRAVVGGIKHRHLVPLGTVVGEELREAFLKNQSP